MCPLSLQLRLEESKLSPFYFESSYIILSPFFHLSVKLIDCRSEKGGATKRAPENWTTSLATVFQSKYLGTITTYYPYSPVSNTTSTPSPSINIVPPPSIIPSPSNPGPSRRRKQNPNMARCRHRSQGVVWFLPVQGEMHRHRIRGRFQVRARIWWRSSS